MACREALQLADAVLCGKGEKGADDLDALGVDELLGRVAGLFVATVGPEPLEEAGCALWCRVRGDACERERLDVVLERLGGHESGSRRRRRC